jgi:hypothetical protein
LTPLALVWLSTGGVNVLSSVHSLRGTAWTFIDGDAVKGASDARTWDALKVLFPHSCRDLNGDETIEAKGDIVADIGRGQVLPIDGLTQLKWP